MALASNGLFEEVLSYTLLEEEVQSEYAESSISNGEYMALQVAYNLMSG